MSQLLDEPNRSLSLRHDGLPLLQELAEAADVVLHLRGHGCELIARGLELAGILGLLEDGCLIALL